MDGREPRRKGLSVYGHAKGEPCAPPAGTSETGLELTNSIAATYDRRSASQSSGRCHAKSCGVTGHLVQGVLQTHPAAATVALKHCLAYRLRKSNHAVTGGPEAGRERTPTSENKSIATDDRLVIRVIPRQFALPRSLF